MLNELHIENIAVIERADLSFGRGLNVLTGETGAGKSIVIDSIGAVLGERVSRELVRRGAEKGMVSAVFDAAGCEDWLRDNEIEADDEPFSDEDSFVQESEPTPSLRESAPEPVRPAEPPLREVPEPQPRAPRPAQRHASGEPEIIRPKSTTHARRTFTYFGVIVSLLAAGALVFSGVTLIRILRPRFGRPDAPRSIYEPVARANNLNAGIIRIQRSDSSSQKQQPAPAAQDKKPAAAAEQELPEKVKINYAGVNVRDDHSTQGTQVIGKAAKGDVKLLEYWEGKDQYPWYRIEAKNVTGWVYGRYVDVPPKPKAKNAPQLDGNERMGRVTRSGVNVRDDHSTKNTRVVGRRSNQDVVIIDEWKAEGASYPWYKLRLDNGEGWIYGKYVELK